MSSSNHDESGYDPMKMLQQNRVKRTEDEIEDVSKDNTESCDKIAESNTDNKKKRKRHPNADNNNDDEIAAARKTEKNTKYSGVNQESDSKAEDTNQSNRQTILLSATLTQNVEKLAGLTMRNPLFIDAAKENLEVTGGDASEINEDLIVPQSVTQSYIVTPPKLRMVTLSAYITQQCQVRDLSVLENASLCVAFRSLSCVDI